MEEKKRGNKVSESRKEKKKRRLILSDSEEEDYAFLISSKSKGDEIGNGGNHAEVEAKSNLGSEVVMQTKAESMEKSDKAAEVREMVEKIVEAESKEKAENAVEFPENVENIAEVEMKGKAEEVRENFEKIEEADKAEKVAGVREIVEKIEEVESKEKAMEVCEKLEMIEEFGSEKIQDGSLEKEESSKEEMEVDAEVVVKKHEGTHGIKKAKDDSAVCLNGSIIKKGSKEGVVKVEAKKVLKSVVKEKEGTIVKKRSSEEAKVEVKKVLKSIFKEKEGVESIVKKRSSEEVVKVEVKKVLKSEVGKEKERVERGKSFSKKKNSEGGTFLEEKKDLKLTPLKRKEVVESVKRVVELGSGRKRNREALGDDEDDPSLKRLRSLRSSCEKSSATEINEKNMKIDSLVYRDQIHDVKVDRERRKDNSREKGTLMKKNMVDSEKVKCTDESTARTLKKMKDRALSGSVRREEVGISPQKSIRVQSRSGVLRVLPSNKDVSRSKGVHIRRGDEEDGAADRPSHSKQKIGERPIATAKPGKNLLKSKQVSLTETEKPKAKTGTGVSTPKVKQKIVDSSNIKTDSAADEDTSRKRRTMKLQIRDDIRDILFEAGWKLDLRPRKGRAYEDAVYVPPSGKGSYWSITKAYAIYVEDCKKNNLCTFATVPSERLRMLTRNVVNKRRSSAEMKEAKKRLKLGGKKKGKESLKTKESKKNSEGVGSTAHKRHLKGRNKKQRGCKLLVRGANKDAEADEDDYVPYVGKRTILSWMIDLGIVRADGKVNYMNKSHSRALLEGYITRDGIRCSCCSKIISVAKFEIHAGSKRCQPYQNIFVVEAGISLLQCQLNAWEKQQNPARQAFIKLDIDGDDPNDDTCGICGDGGDLICCDGCPSTFHLNCMGIQMLPPGDWLCTNCSCRYCGSISDSDMKESASTIPKLLTCSQCDKKYHQECIPIEVDAISVCSSKSNNSFCGQGCKKIFGQLQKLIGTKNDLEAGLSWSIVRCFHGESSGSPCNLPEKADCNSKIAVAYAVMDECFYPIIDERSGINLIHNVVHNCGSNFSRLSYTGFYTFLLERGDEIISVASVRIHGTRLAEMPFIGTRSMYRRQGMCRQLLNGIESALYSLDVEKLIIPAISELAETWTNIFGFKPLELSQKKDVKSINIMVFPGTGLLHKPILKDSIEQRITSDGAKPGKPAQHKLSGLAGDVVQPENEIDEQLVIQTNENSDPVSLPKSEVQTLHCNSSETASNVCLSIRPTVVDQNEFKGEDKLNVLYSDENIKISSENSLYGNPVPESASAIESENQLNSNSNTKIEVPCESIMLNTLEANGRDATVASNLDALHAISVEYTTEDGYTCQEAAKEAHTDGLLINGDSNVVVECKPPYMSSALQNSDTNHHHSSGPVSELTSSSIVEHDSCAAGQHIVDCNHGIKHAVQGADEVVADVRIKPGRCAEGVLDTKLMEDDLAGITPAVSFGLCSLCSTSNAVVESSN